jgi:hypothetical protein
VDKIPQTKLLRTAQNKTEHCNIDFKDYPSDKWPIQAVALMSYPSAINMRYHYMSIECSIISSEGKERDKKPTFI